LKKPPFIATGAILAFLAVAFGAFGAHGLKQVLNQEMLVIFHTAVTYQTWHALGLILIGILFQLKPSSLLIKAGWAMLAGIILFSGSLYVLSLSGIKILGMITPMGGIAFLIAWALIAIYAIKQKL